MWFWRFQERLSDVLGVSKSFRITVGYFRGFKGRCIEFEELSRAFQRISGASQGISWRFNGFSSCFIQFKEFSEASQECYMGLRGVGRALGDFRRFYALGCSQIIQEVSEGSWCVSGDFGASCRDFHMIPRCS